MGKVGQVVVDIEGGGQLNHVVGVVVRRVDLAAGVVESGVNQVVEVAVVGTGEEGTACTAIATCTAASSAATSQAAIAAASARARTRFTRRL